MSLPAPNLDDRKFQDIVDEAKRRIPRYCPTWTDHNVSDPGVTLIELMAWMSEMIIYRLNQVPERHYIKFLDMLGVKLDPGRAARTEITFFMASPQPHTIVIPKNTEVATIRTENEEAIVFSTETTLKIVVPQLRHLLISRVNPVTKQAEKFYDATQYIRPADTPLNDPQSFAAFTVDPQKGAQEGDAIYFGFDNNIEGNIIVLKLECDPIGGTGIDPTNPPLIWEYRRSSDRQWNTLDVAFDTTGGLNLTGEVGLFVPYDVGRMEVDLKPGYWLRVRAIQAPANLYYRESPRVAGVQTESRGGSVSAINASLIVDEDLGESSGKPGQFFTVRNSPILPFTSTEEMLEIEPENEQMNWERWTPVTTFALSDVNSLHYMLDHINGQVRFGPEVRQPDGTVKQYGKIPSKGKRIRLTYRYGGGVQGNLRENMLTQIKTSIPYVSSVTNRVAARGGTDPEDLEDAKLKGQKMLRVQERAVTQEDYEYLAKQASSTVHRAKCVPTRASETGEGENAKPPPGIVHLLIVPNVPNPDSLIPLDHLRPNPKTIDEIYRNLYHRMPLGVYLNVSAPFYKPVSVVARIHCHLDFDPEAVVTAVEEKLYQYINPIKGGPDNSGMEIGRDLRLPEVYAAIHSVEGVEFATNVELHEVDKDGRLLPPVPTVKVDDDTVICSAKHEVTLMVSE